LRLERSYRLPAGLRILASAGRVGHGPAAGPGAPDLAVEVLSPNDRTPEVLAKVSDYLAAGSRLVWVADPVNETVQVFRSPLAPRVLEGQDALEGEEVLIYRLCGGMVLIATARVACAARSTGRCLTVVPAGSRPR
jgi:hypothetical protein